MLECENDAIAQCSPREVRAARLNLTLPSPIDLSIF